MLQTELVDVVQLISDMRHCKIYSSYEVANHTEKLVEKLISNGKWETAKDLMVLIKARIYRIISALPQESTAVNVMRHILKIIREEYISGFKGKGDNEQSLHQLVTAELGELEDYSKPLPTLRSSLLDNLSEYRAEIESSTDNIASQALDHIHTNEIILTVGKSNTVEKFLKYAAKRQRRFEVIVVEAAPLYHGHNMAANLSRSKIKTTVIPDSAVFAVMSRVNKVIIGTHTVMANGGLRAACGVHMIALAAKRYSIPIMVLAHMYKLSPVHLCFEQDAFNICSSPAEVLPYSSGPMLDKVHVYNPVYDYVPPELVTLFISHQNCGTYTDKVGPFVTRSVNAICIIEEIPDM
ncbi:hypothetical protein FQA39_LY00443 [Lamprigera yunnana]|nr:hypothetical protein FQA39_LY00443 [Lamprigera yunnana]